MRKSIFSLVIAGTFIACEDSNKNQETASTENPASVSEQAIPISSEDIPASSAEYDHEVVVPDLQIPWGMVTLPDGDLLITEKGGDLIRFSDGKKTLIAGAPEVYNRGQGGFLDVALDPDYENNGWIYFTYASSEGEGEGGNTALMRAKLEGDQLVEKEVLYKAVPNSTRGQHFGSRIAFDEEGYLYFSIGERGNRDENPQDLTRDGGKVYRLNRDGSIPDDNPFVNQEEAKKAIFSYGHRNPQGMIFHPVAEEIWVHEHGPQGGDEINVVKKGENYGWPLVTYGINYDGTPITEKTSGPEFQDPIFFWRPSIAPSGFAYVTSEKYPELQGDLLVGSLKFQYLEQLEMDGKKVVSRKKLLEGIGRIRDVIQGTDGNIYVSAEGLGIVRLIPKAQ